MPPWTLQTNVVSLSGGVKVAVATSPGSIGPVLRSSASIVKLRARDRAQLVVIAYESGLVRPGWAGSG
jgi:hypothetical protein